MTRRRFAGLGALFAAAALALTGCQPSTGTAAYVGNERITEEQLQAAVNDGLAQPGVQDTIRTQYQGDLSEYRRTVLFRAVQHRLVSLAAQQTGVRTNDTEVSQLISLEGGFDRLRTNGGLSAAAATQQARDQLLTTELGYTRGGVPRPTDAQLQAAYQAQKLDNSTAQLGLLQLPDPATLRRVLAHLRTDPASFAALASAYPSGSQPAATPYKVSELKPALRQEIISAAPDTFVSYVGTDTGTMTQYLVIKVYRVDSPSLADLRLSLSQESLATAYSAGQGYLAKLAQQVGVRVNPRYGTWNAKELQIDAATNPVLTLTESTAPGVASGANPSGSNPAVPNPGGTEAP